MHAQCARYGTPADGCAVQPPLAAHVRPHTVIEKQHVRPSQTSLQTACGCSEMRAVASGSIGHGGSFAMAAKIYNLCDLFNRR